MRNDDLSDVKEGEDLILCQAGFGLGYRLPHYRVVKVLRVTKTLVIIEDGRDKSATGLGGQRFWKEKGTRYGSSSKFGPIPRLYRATPELRERVAQCEAHQRVCALMQALEMHTRSARKGDVDYRSVVEHLKAALAVFKGGDE